MAKFFIVIGIITMVLSGGCSLLVIGDAYVGFGDVLLIGGIPFAVGLLVVLLARVAQRRKEAREHEKIRDRWKTGGEER